MVSFFSVEIYSREDSGVFVPPVVSHRVRHKDASSFLRAKKSNRAKKYLSLPQENLSLAMVNIIITKTCKSLLKTFCKALSIVYSRDK